MNISDSSEYFSETNSSEPSYSWFGYLLILAMGSLVTAVLGFNFQAGLFMSTTSVPLDDAAMEIKQEATTAHLWFEEILSGDSNMEMDAVWEHINKAAWFAEAILRGGISPAGEIYPLKDPELRGQVEEIQVKIAFLKTLVAERYLNASNSGPGTDIDRQFDTVFADLVNMSEAVETAIHQSINQTLQSFRSTQTYILTACLILTLLAIRVFYLFDSRKIRDFKIIQAANKRLILDMIERRKAEDALMKSSQLAAVGQVASGVAHEINNPLATISACTEVLRNNLHRIAGKDNMYYRVFDEYFSLIDEETQRSSRIVRELLDFSQYRNIVLKPCDVNDIVESTVQRFSIQDRFNSYTFTIEKKGDPGTVFADGDKLRQVLIILFTNAVDAMPEGGKVTITTDHNYESKHILISVSDRGMGIMSESREKLFEPFFTTKIEQRGTGLGLTIAQGILNEHNGKITVHSEPDKGSTFTLWLPCIDEQHESDSKAL